MTPSLLNGILDARRNAESAVLLTRLADGEQMLWLESAPASAADEIPDALVDAAKDALRLDKSRTVEIDGESWFVHQFNSPLRMIVVGAVHIAQALVPMAAASGYAVTVVDPRRAFASDARFPNVAVSTDWPDTAMRELAPDRRTAVVTLTHDPKLDDPALQVALESDAFYIGSLGSRKTHAARLERLTEHGFSADVLDRIHGPIGLNIGASSPAEIAISVLAQVTSHLRQKAES